MKRDIILHFQDLCKDTQEKILETARKNILEESRDEIVEEFGEDMLEQVVAERVDHELLNMNFIMNV